MKYIFLLSQFKFFDISTIQENSLTPFNEFWFKAYNFESCLPAHIRMAFVTSAEKVLHQCNQILTHFVSISNLYVIAWMKEAAKVFRHAWSVYWMCSIRHN